MSDDPGRSPPPPRPTSAKRPQSAPRSRPGSAAASPSPSQQHLDDGLGPAHDEPGATTGGTSSGRGHNTTAAAVDRRRAADDDAGVYADDFDDSDEDDKRPAKNTPSNSARGRAQGRTRTPPRTKSASSSPLPSPRVEDSPGTFVTRDSDLGIARTTSANDPPKVASTQPGQHSNAPVAASNPLQADDTHPPSRPSSQSGYTAATRTPMARSHLSQSASIPRDIDDTAQPASHEATSRDDTPLQQHQQQQQTPRSGRKQSGSLNAPSSSAALDRHHSSGTASRHDSNLKPVASYTHPPPSEPALSRSPSSSARDRDAAAIPEQHSAREGSRKSRKTPPPPPAGDIEGDDEQDARAVAASDERGRRPRSAGSSRRRSSAEASANATPTTTPRQTSGSNSQRATPRQPAERKGSAAAHDGAAKPAVEKETPTKKRHSASSPADPPPAEEQRQEGTAAPAKSKRGSDTTASSSMRAEKKPAQSPERVEPKRQRAASHSQAREDQDASADGNGDGDEQVLGAEVWYPPAGTKRAKKPAAPGSTAPPVVKGPPKAHRWAGATIGANTFLVGGIVNGAPSADVFAWNPQRRAFKALGPGAGGSESRPPKVTGHTVTACGVCGNYLAVIGGGADTVYMLSADTLGWTKIPRANSLSSQAWVEDPRDPNDRKGHAAVEHDGAVYAFFGQTRHGKTNLVDRFVLSSAEWEPMSAPVLDARDAGAAKAKGTTVQPLSHLTATVISGKALLIGGRDAAGDPSAAVHMYDFSARQLVGDVMAGCAEGPAPRYGHAAVATSPSTIAVYGGTAGACEFLGDLWELNAHDFVWRQITVVGLPARAYGVLGVIPKDAASDDDQGDADDGGKEDSSSSSSTSVAGLAYFGGGSLPPAGSSRYAQLTFTASNDILRIGTMPRRRTIGYIVQPGENDEEQHGSSDASPSEGQSPQKPSTARGGARGRPASAPATRQSPRRAAGADGDDDDNGVAEGGGYTGNRSSDARAAAAVHGRQTSYWKLGGDFPPAPPVPRRVNNDHHQHDDDGIDERSGMSAKTLARLCPSKAERDQKRDALMKAVDERRGYGKSADSSTHSKLTMDQVQTAATRMSTAEQDRRTKKRELLRNKVMGEATVGSRPGSSAAALRLTSEQQEVQVHTLYARDVERFEKRRQRAVSKYGYLPQQRRTKSPSTTEELNERFYTGQKTREEKLAILRKKHIKEPEPVQLSPEELEDFVSRLNEGKTRERD